MNEDSPLIPWWRQFWPWVLLLLPATVVIAGFVTLVISIDGADSLVRDDYYKEGMGINRRLAQDDEARRRNILAEISFDNTGRQLSARLTGNLESAPDSLLIDFIHPNDAQHDFSVRLDQRRDARYFARLPIVIEHRWQLQIRDADRPDSGWRLRSLVMVPDAAVWTIRIDAD